jgi:Ca2+-binding RTX toxin-like protein
VTVNLLTPEGNGWLVAGLDDDDSIVVHGAGVLWSLEGLGSFSAEEEDHD